MTPLWVQKPLQESAFEVGEAGGAEGFVNGTEERFAAEGFFKEEAVMEKFVVLFHLLEIAGHENDLEIGEKIGEAGGEFGPAHSGHYDVGKQSTDGRAVLFGDAQRFDAVLGSENAETGRVQKAAGEFTDGSVVFHNENCESFWGGWE